MDYECGKGVDSDECRYLSIDNVYEPCSNLDQRAQCLFDKSRFELQLITPVDNANWCLIAGAIMRILERAIQARPASDRLIGQRPYPVAADEMDALTRLLADITPAGTTLWAKNWLSYQLWLTLFRDLTLQNPNINHGTVEDIQKSLSPAEKLSVCLKHTGQPFEKTRKCEDCHHGRLMERMKNMESSQTTIEPFIVVVNASFLDMLVDEGVDVRRYINATQKNPEPATKTPGVQPESILTKSSKAKYVASENRLATRTDHGRTVTSTESNKKTGGRNCQLDEWYVKYSHERNVRFTRKPR